MTVARASKQDIEAGLALLGLLDSVSKGYYPVDPAQPDADTPTFLDGDNIDHLQHLYRLLQAVLDRAPGFQGRMLFGAATLLDERNAIVDVTADHLALHPRLQAAGHEHARLKRAQETMGDVIDNHCIAMQAAVIEARIGNGLADGMAWIENTLGGPGLLPDMAEAQRLGGAQAWFDAKSAETRAGKELAAAAAKAAQR